MGREGHREKLSSERIEERPIFTPLQPHPLAHVLPMLTFTQRLSPCVLQELASAAGKPCNYGSPVELPLLIGKLTPQPPS